jgi:hemolysin type calcium-binding protein/calcineurin-like phosphoesterase family protein
MRSVSGGMAPEPAGSVNARRFARRAASILLAAAFLSSIATASAGAADPVIAAAGDIACSPSGAATSTKCRQGPTSDLLVTSGLSAVLPLGDLQYAAGSFSSFTKSYGVSWGRVKPITFPAAGNHEYLTSGAKGYFDYFNGAGAFSGRAGDRDKGFYSFDIGTWHLIALNTSDHCTIVACGQGSPQEAWLKADLAAHPTSCTLAYWHHPRFNSGHDGNASFMQPMFQDLYDANADVVLGGHAHDYERFAPQNPQGKLDTARGIRQFVVGTGGAFFTGLGSRLPNSEVRNGATYGVLMLTLHPTSYDWRFVPEKGATFTDSGTNACHGLVAPLPQAPAAPRQAPSPRPRISTSGIQKESCTILGTPGDDVLTGTPGQDVICGLGGKDLINGGAGADLIDGGAGNDRIFGGPGTDGIHGGAGRDKIRGGADGDELLGGRGRDILFGGTGDDVLHGNFENDVLHGNSGNDVIVGDGGRNRLYGDAGDDHLSGWRNRRGGDRIYGGEGRDEAEANRADRVRSAIRLVPHRQP